MAKRRTSGIQRRGRASDRAYSATLGVGGPSIDRRLVAVAGGGLLAIGLAVGMMVVAISGGGPPSGIIQPDGGAGHIPDGAQGGPYTSVPATSGAHWATPAQWDVYTSPLAESQVLHNLEHSGIVIWYQPAQLDAAALSSLTAYVASQLHGSRFKVILSPWSGRDFGHPIAVSAWRYLLYLDRVDTDAMNSFVDAHYGRGPEPAGGPGPPAQ